MEALHQEPDASTVIRIKTKDLSPQTGRKHFIITKEINI